MRLEKIITDLPPGFARDPGDGLTGVAQLRTNNINGDGEIDVSAIKRVDATSAEAEKYAVVSGDVILNNTNSPELVGKTAVFEESSP